MEPRNYIVTVDRYRSRGEPYNSRSISFRGRVKESGRIQQQRRNRAPIEVGADGGVDPVIGRTFLQRAGSDDRPETFAKIPPSLASSALGYMAVHHHETHGLFGGIIGGLSCLSAALMAL